MERTVIQSLASAVQARANCLERGNTEWVNRHELTIADIEANWLPHGSGFDSGCKVDLERSTDTRILFQADFHHMDQDGYYDGWSEHTVTVTPSFDGVCLKIGGRDRDDWKGYAYEVISYALSVTYKPSPID